MVSLLNVLCRIMEFPLFRTQYNQAEDRPRGEFNQEPSLTVPDESLSIKDILYRYAQGMPLDEYRRNVTYGDDIETQENDDFEVHPANTFAHDILDLLPASDNLSEAVHAVPPKEVTPKRDDDINDDAKKVTS